VINRFFEATPRNGGGAANQEEADSGKPEAYRSVLRQSRIQRLATSGCFKISANACIRLTSAGLFVVAALLSKDIPKPLSFASDDLFMRELSAVSIAFRRAAI
jgi:hypothetical protein